MDWREIGTGGGVYSWGEDATYLVSVLEREVRLSRFRYPAASPLRMATDVARNVIVFPLGRGPGRPGGEPELAALMESAKVYAERYEAGESLEGYPAWRHERPEPAFRLREGESVRFIGEPPEPFPRQAGPGEFGTSHVYGTQPGCCAPEPPGPAEDPEVSDFAGLLGEAAARVPGTADAGFLDREVAGRVQAFLGHVEDMRDDERVWALGYLASAVLRLLGTGSADD